MGGAGTRVYRAIAEAAGYKMLVTPWPHRVRGTDHHDNRMMAKYFYGAWIDRYHRRRLSYVEHWLMRTTCVACLWSSGPTNYGRGLWGWKNPRSILLLPFFNDLYPSMLFLHVVRDGRDHAFHPKFSYMAHQTSVLSAAETELPDTLRKGLIWSRVNRMGSHYGEQQLNARYLQSTLEKLCADPPAEVGRILAFLGTHDRQIIERTTALVKRPSSLGRWQPEPRERIAAVEELIGEDLVRYGYPLAGTG
jgi:hypothetical protein